MWAVTNLRTQKTTFKEGNYNPVIDVFSTKEGLSLLGWLEGTTLAMNTFR